MITLFANTTTNLAQGFSGPGPIGKGGENPVGVLESVFTTIFGFLTIAAILWFTLQIILGGLGWISAGGDPKAVEGARKRLTNAVIGIVIVFAAASLVSLVGSLLGVDFLNIAALFTQIK